VDNSCKNQGLREAFLKNYCILKVKPAKRIRCLVLGSLNDAKEGTSVYTCGFPKGIDQSVVSVGILSSKWVMPPSSDKGSPLEVAWLDIAMNRGNSGAPIILMGQNPDDDKVVAMASFDLGLFAKYCAEVTNMADDFPENAVIMGINLKEFSAAVGSSLTSSSSALGGCIAIDYLKSSLANKLGNKH
jgi:hypothetical protein